jgi:hypothetical protein
MGWGGGGIPRWATAIGKDIALKKPHKIIFNLNIEVKLYTYKLICSP